MKINLFTFLCAFYLISCGRAPTALISPSSDYVVATEISGTEAGPKRNDCVRIVVINQKTKDKFSFQTGASNFQKWAIGWSPQNVLILYSSDIGTHAYDISSNAITERSPNKEEMKIGEALYVSKYKK